MRAASARSATASAPRTGRPLRIAIAIGHWIGAVNLLVTLDGTAHRDLLAKADKCRSLARWVTDKQTEDVLTGMAMECERQAAALRLD